MRFEVDENLIRRACQLNDIQYEPPGEQHEKRELVGGAGDK